MEIGNIHTYPTGPLGDPSYKNDLLILLSKYKDSFGDAEFLDISLEELPMGYKNGIPIIFSEDGMKITIRYTTQRYKKTKGNGTVFPTPDEVYSSLNSLMKRAVKEYAKKFNDKHENE